LYLTCWFPNSQQARILGAFMIALPLSSAIGAPVSAAILNLSATGLRGWQWMFLLEGVPAALVGVAAFLLLTDRPEQAHWLSSDEKNLLTRARSQTEQGQQVSRGWDALRNPRIWRLGVVYFTVLVALYGTAFWLPQIIHSLGNFGHREVGLLTVAPNLAATLVIYPWSRLASTNYSRWHIGGPLILSATGVAIAALSDGAPQVIGALMVAAMGMYSCLPVFWSLPSNRLKGAAAAAGIALVNSIGNIGGYVGPAAFGYLRQLNGGYKEALLLLSAALVLGAAMVLVGGRSASESGL